MRPQPDAARTAEHPPSDGPTHANREGRNLSAMGSQLEPLQTLDRFALQVRALRRYWTTLLMGTPPAKWAPPGRDDRGPDKPADFVAQLLNQASQPTHPEVDDALNTFCEHAFRWLDAAFGTAGSATNSPSVAVRPRAWCRWVAKTSQSRTLAGKPSEATLLGMMQANYVITHELAGRRQLLAEDGVPEPSAGTVGKWKRLQAECLQRLDGLTDGLDGKPLSTGEMVSHLLALTGIWWLLGGLPAAASSSAGQWDRLWSDLNPALHPFLVRLVARNELALTAVPALRRAFDEPKTAARFRPWQTPLRLVPRVQDVLKRLQTFNTRLTRVAMEMSKQEALAECPAASLAAQAAASAPAPEPESPAAQPAEPATEPAAPSLGNASAAQISELVRQIATGEDRNGALKPIWIGQQAEGELVRFALDSPWDRAEEREHTRRQLLMELTAAERELMESTVAPRFAFLGHAFTWGRFHLPLVENCGFPLSASCFHVTMFCHNLLARAQGQAVGEVQAREERERLDKAVLASGDMFAVHQALCGLRPWLGQRYAQSEAVSWDELLGKLPAEIRQGVLLLAEKSPLARMCEPAFDGALDEKGIGWRQLGDFLHCPQAEPLRDFAAGRVLDAMRRDFRVLEGSPGRVLQTCLKTEELGGVQFVAEVLQSWLQDAFGACDNAIPGGRMRSVPGEVQRRRESFERALESFRERFLDIRVPATRQVFELLVQLLQGKARWERQQTGERRSMAILRNRWHSIHQTTLRGLSSRPWPHRAQRLLRIFWLNFCFLAADHFDELPNGLDTGQPAWDNLSGFAAYLVAQLRQTLRLQLESEKRMRGAEELMLYDKATSYLDVADARELAVIQRYLGDPRPDRPDEELHVFRKKPLLRALKVRRFCREEVGSLTWDDKSVEAAATQHP